LGIKIYIESSSVDKGILHNLNGKPVESEEHGKIILKMDSRRIVREDGWRMGLAEYHV